MNSTDFRQQLMADPFSDDPALQQALQNDSRLQAFATELQQQHLELVDALQIPVPPALSEQLLDLPKQQGRKSWWQPLALAASVALISLIGMQWYVQQHSVSDLGQHALAHVYHEEDYLSGQLNAQPLSEVNLKLASFDASLQDWQDDIIYARYCTFQGITSLHLAVKTATGYATVFVVPKETALSTSASFADQRYQGITINMPKANVVVVSDNAADLQKLPQKLRDKLVFSA